MRGLFLRAVRVPLFLVLLAAVAASAAVGGLALWAAVGEVPLIDVQFFPDDDPPPPAATPAVVDDDPPPPTATPAVVDDGSDSLTVTVPPGFTTEIVAAGFTVPTTVVPIPDGRLLVAEKGGRIWVVEDRAGGAALVLDLSAEVNDAGERGLLGMAIAPDFEESGWLYLAYTVDPIPGQPDEPAETVTFARVVRYQTKDESGQLAADPESRHVLVGETAADGIPVGFSSHTVGDLVFGADGSLFVSTGDGAHWNFTDYGQDEGYYDPLFAQMFGDEQDIGSFRAQSLDSLAGKILRLDPATGEGLSTNPFFTGDPAEPASKVWALGFRNPFRFTIRPGPDAEPVLYVGDPGTSLENWEEVNVVTAGANGGWPCFEGDVVQADFAAVPEARQQCEGLAREDTVAPLLRYNRSDPGSAGFVGSVIVGGLFFESPGQDWDGLYFFADSNAGFIRALEVDEGGGLASVRLFADGLRLAKLAQGSSGELYVVEVWGGRILRIAFEGP